MLKSNKRLVYAGKLPIPTAGPSLISWFVFTLTLEPAGEGGLQVFLEEMRDEVES